MKKKILIGVLILFLIISGVVAFFLFGPGGEKLEKFVQTKQYNIPSDAASCGDKKEFFSVSPVAYEDFSDLAPLGTVSPPSHTFPTDHMYFFIKNENINDPESIPNKVPVYAPGDMTITKIGSQERYEGGDLLSSDYNMDFVPCKEVSGYFIHLSSISDKLKEEFDEQQKMCNEYSTGGYNYKNCEAGVEIKVKAGEQIGTAGGMKDQAALDLGMIDFRADPLTYANQKRWQGKSVSTVCPLDYFSSPAKEELFAKVGDNREKRTIEPICGQIDQDIAGTSQGVWFKKGTPENPKSTHPEDPHLSLVHDNVNYAQPVFSIGNSVQGLEAGRYY
ncbi:hypothetical protein IID23_03070 [Patescibacteria group bacterium]|nr:hypothetical protein [Patescibacteria group bacterium]